MVPDLSLRVLRQSNKPKKPSWANENLVDLENIYDQLMAKLPNDLQQIIRQQGI
jgi:hypothetical protein